MSAAPGGSYLKFDYALRPSKQVERMLIVEMLHHLSQDLPNLRLSEYSYVGFGSPYYTDFILFHKYLYIKHMVCIEGKPIPKRMDFNKPYDFIDLWMEMFSAFLPRLDRQTPHVLWLDYDTPLSGEHIKDIQGAANVLQAGSFLFVTLDADGRIPDDLDLPDRSDDEKYDDTVQLYRDDFGRYTAETITRSDLAPASLPKLFTSVARTRLTRRAGVAASASSNCSTYAMPMARKWCPSVALSPRQRCSKKYGAVQFMKCRSLVRLKIRCRSRSRL